MTRWTLYTGFRKYFNENEITDITVNGAPKTIDNDLNGIDHCPGFGSTAKYIATVCSELAREVKVYDRENILIVEIMGRKRRLAYSRCGSCS